jgi:bleomycin hydrolase
MDISSKDLDLFSKTFESKPEFKVSRNAIANNNFFKVIINRDYSQSINEVFDKKINIDVKSTNQESSGRCWLFAMLNVIRLGMVEKYKLDKDFEFSQNYLFFYDKLEKCNYFMRNMVSLKKELIDSRIMLHLLNEPISDGGNINMFCNLIEKYGIVPKVSMSESFHSNSSGKLNTIINNKMKEAAYQIRNMKGSKVNVYIKQVLSDIYAVLVLFLGQPPKKINWEYYTSESESKTPVKKKVLRKSKKKGGSFDTYKIVKNVTPLQFYNKIVPFEMKKILVFTHNPMREYNKLYSVKYCNNITDTDECYFINLPLKKIKEMTIKSINGNDAVWFGSDVAKYQSNSLGILDKNAFNYKDTIGFDISLNKKDQLDYRISKVSHAMVFKGYSLKNSDKWLVENSWGDETGKHGNFTMSDSWFDDYVYEVAIHAKYVDFDILKILTQKAIELEPWDPFGFLLR